MDQVALGRLRQQPEGEVLRADGTRTATDSRGSSKLGADGGPDGQVSRRAGGRAVIWGRVLDVFRRRRLDADLESQLWNHVDALEAEFLAKGLAPDDASAAARRAIGGLTQVKEAYRDQLSIPMLDTIWQDLRYACRVLRRNRGFSAVALLILAIGIASTTIIFSFLDAVLFKPLPYAHGDRIVRILERRPTGATAWFSVPAYLDWQTNSTLFEQIA